MAEVLWTPYQWHSYLTRNRLRILMYHSISADPLDPLAVPPEVFAEQMAFLSEKGFRVVSLSEALDRLARRRNLRGTVCVTFDDGFADFVSAALPVLQRYNFPATLFIVAGEVGGRSGWSSYCRDRPLMDWSDLRTLTDLRYEIGSHTLHHPDLMALEPNQLVAEIANSKAMLEDGLGVAVTAFAYPGGTFGTREVAAIRRAGYRCAVKVGGRWGNGYETDHFRLKREKILRQDNLSQFSRKVSGYCELYCAWQLIAGELTRLIAGARPIGAQRGLK